jgi:hypothetical protein
MTCFCDRRIRRDDDPVCDDISERAPPGLFVGRMSPTGILTAATAAWTFYYFCGPSWTLVTVNILLIYSMQCAPA